MSELHGAVKPNSLEAERSVLGAMLQDADAVLKAVEHLRREDFYQPQHQEIYDAILAVHRRQLAVDLVTVDEELSRRGSLDGIGGTGYLMELCQFVPTTANVGAYIRIVREKSVLRLLIGAAQSISQECYSQQVPTEEALSHAEKSVFDIVMQRAGGESMTPISDVLIDTYAYVEQLDRLKGAVSGVPTGFRLLDDMLTGLHAGELILIGARPSMGKTSFAVNIAAHAGVVAQRKVAIFSMEMPREQIALRMLCSEARVDMQRVRQGRLGSEEWGRLARALAPLSMAQVFIDDTAGLSPAQLRSRCRRLMMDKGLDLVIVDYLGLMHSDGRAENRQLEISEITRTLKAIALELKIPLVVCAQLSRAPSTRPEKRPILSDLRDSGSIEQDADVVMFLHREAYYDKDADRNIGEVIVSKQRNGPLGTVKLAWLPEYTTYANLETPGGQDAPY